MKTFLLVICFAVFGFTISSCEQRNRRQIWGRPPDTDRLIFQHSPEIHGFFDGAQVPWPGPPMPGRPSRNQNNFQNLRDDNLYDVDGGMFDYDDVGFNNDVSRNNNGRNDRNQNQRQNQNQNQNRRTTESSGPITSTPRTIHIGPQGCNCPVTQQFNPVCGTDGNTYRNEGLLNCYRRCGTRVSRKRLGTC